MMHAIDVERIRALPRPSRERLAQLIAETKKRDSQRQFYNLFPERDTIQPDGSIIHARAKYGKHLEFFNAGAEYRERCFMAANRTGKTIAGTYEDTCHLTGIYPDWWEGRWFTRPVRGWVAGKTNETTRDILQAALVGHVTGSKAEKGVSGTGMIPGGLIGKLAWKQGVTDLLDTVKIRHASGGWSTLGLKSYQQGRGSFEGTAQEFIHLDEECPLDVYGECLIRTATTNGVVMLTFTPLDGMTPVVLEFMPKDERPAA